METFGVSQSSRATCALTFLLLALVGVTQPLLTFAHAVVLPPDRASPGGQSLSGAEHSARIDLRRRIACLSTESPR